MPTRSALIQYHLYAWRRFRWLLIENWIINYLLPGLAEFLPWFLSRRHVAQRLRQSRSTIEHTVIGGTLPRRLIVSYLCKALLYSSLCALDSYLRNDVARRSRAVLERQLLQRLMSTDLQAINAVYKRLYGLETRTDLVYKRICTDLDLISETVNTTLPGAVRNLVVFARSLADIYPRRHQVDALAVLRPTMVAVAADLYSRLQQTLLPCSTPNSQPHDDLVATIVERLAEIQGANLQNSHLSLLDKVAEATGAWQQLIGAGFNQVSKAISGHSVIEFATEALMARRVMARAQIDHETYRKVQIDVDYSVNILRKAASLFYQAYQGIEQSAGFAAILSLKTFRTSSPPRKKNLSFNAICINSVCYNYDSSSSPALNITMPITFESGCTYALLGPNGAGKSTLIRVLMKLLPPGPQSRITVDGVPFTSIERYTYRRHIGYVSQRAYLLPGSIADNIRIGHPFATEQQVEEAARLAGLFLFENHSASLDGDQVLPDFQELVALAVSLTERSAKTTSQILQQPIDSIPISGSMAQAIALSRVFLSDKNVRVIILDEALALIDTSKVHSFVWPNLVGFARKRGMTIIVATSDPFVFEQADFVAIMEAGEVVDYGSPNELLQARKPSYLRFRGLTDRIDTTVDQL